MVRLFVDRFTVASKVSRFSVGKKFAAVGRHAKSILALVASFSLLTTPVWAAPSSSSLGVVVYADRAHVGAASAAVGTTVFNGDRISAEQNGGVQVRLGAARLQLSSNSVATFSQQEGTRPSATLAAGTATFSTANANAFALHFGSAMISPTDNRPTIGQVTVINAKELVVKSNRGSLTIAVDDDVREIPEGVGYRVVLDPDAAQGPQGAGTKGYGGPPIKAAKSKFIWYAIGISAVVTAIAIHAVLESPDRP
jgi:hypothetical protein